MTHPTRLSTESRTIVLSTKLWDKIDAIAASVEVSADGVLQAALSDYWRESSKRTLREELRHVFDVVSNAGASAHRILTHTGLSSEQVNQYLTRYLEIVGHHVIVPGDTIEADALDEQMTQVFSEVCRMADV